MVEAWLIELAKGIGKFFLNPALYWFLFILTMASYFRIKRERYDFGIKIYPKFMEWHRTWLVSLISGILISAVIIGTGMVFSYETLLVLALSFVVLSISTRFTLLSPSYTLGLTFLILFFAPYLIDMQGVIDYSLLYESSLPALAVLAGLLLFVESLFIKRIEKQDTFPRITLSDRGVWVGEQQIKRLTVVPLLMLVPQGLITSFAPWWPYLSIGESSLGLALIPFLIGFNYKAKGHFHRCDLQAGKSKYLFSNRYFTYCCRWSIYSVSFPGCDNFGDYRKRIFELPLSRRRPFASSILSAACERLKSGWCVAWKPGRQAGDRDWRGHLQSRREKRTDKPSFL